MPRLDGTGPMGQGPMTGRGLGNCSNCGGVLRCYRQGCRRFWMSQEKGYQNKAQDVEDLKAVKKQLEQNLADINKDIEAAEKAE